MSDQHQAGGSGAGSTVDAVRNPLDREGNVLIIDHDPRDCAAPCPVHDAETEPLLRAAFQLRTDLEAARAEIEGYRAVGRTLEQDRRICLDTHCETRHLMDARADLAQARARISELEQGLRRILEWDCLSPEPRSDLLHDLPWLKAHVLAVLDAVTDADA